MAHSSVSRVEIPFARGLAQSVDAKLMPQGAFKRLENWRYDADGRLRVRKAYTAVLGGAIDGNAPAEETTVRLVPHRKSVLRLGSQGYAHAPTIAGDPTSAGLWADVHQYRPARLENATTMATSTKSNSNFSPTGQSAWVNGVSVVAWIDGGAVYAAIYVDEVDVEGFSAEAGTNPKPILVSGPEQLSDGGDTCQDLVVLGVPDPDGNSSDIIVVAWGVAVDNEIHLRQIDTRTKATWTGGWSPISILASDYNSASTFDLCHTGTTATDSVALAYRKNDGTDYLRVQTYTGGLFGSVADSYQIAEAPGKIVAEGSPGSGKLWILYVLPASTTVRLRMLDDNLDLDSNFPVSLNTSFSGSRIGAVATGTSKELLYAVYGTAVRTATSTGTLGTEKTPMLGAKPVSRPFVVDDPGGSGEEQVAIFVVRDHSIGDGAFGYMALGQLTEWDSATAAPAPRDALWPAGIALRGKVGTGSTLYNPVILPRVPSRNISGYTDKRFTVCAGVILQTTQIGVDVGSIQEQAIVRLDWDLSDTGLTAWSHMSTSHASYAAMSSALPQMYDGKHLVEIGFVAPPDVGDSDYTAQSSGGNIPAGTYQYVWVWEWIDADGRRHQSAPSIAVSVTHATGTSNSVDWNIEPLRHTWRTKTGQKPRAVAYRTEEGPGSVFYRCDANWGSDVFPENDETSASDLTWTDVATDATITQNETLYTSAGELGHEALPASQHIVSFNGRLAGIMSEDRTRVWYTAPLKEGEGPAFNATFTTGVLDHGDLVALAVQDGKLYAFSDTALLLAAWGDGPDALGGGAPFGEPVLLTNEVGCADPRSVVLGPDGIFFAGSGDGGINIYLWSRGDAGLVRIGDPVRDELDDMPIVTSAVHVQEHSEIRFTVNSYDMATSAILVYSYGVTTADGPGAWFVHTGDGSGYHSATTWRGRYIYSADSADYIETGTQTTQDAILETGDIWLGGLHGHARCKATTVLGETGPTVQNVDMTLAKSTDNGVTYGESKTFSDSGNDNDAKGYHKRRQWRTQRSQNGAVRFKITASNNDDANPYDLIVNGITIEYMPEPGGPRLSSSDRG